MNQARLIVCEKRGTCAAALSRWLAGEKCRIAATRSVIDCFEALGAWPASFVVLELRRENLTALPSVVARIGGQFPQTRTAVTAPRHLRESEWLFREAGAVHVAFSAADFRTLARLALRHLARLPEVDLPPQQRVLAERE